MTTLKVPRSRSRWRTTPRTFGRLVLGLWIFGTGDALVIAAAIGVSPWDVLALGVAAHSLLSVGLATIVISGVVLLGWIPLRERPGLGTVVNAVLIGLVIDGMLLVLPTPSAVGLQLVQVVLGVAAIGIGSGFYLSTALGPGPRDGLMTGLVRQTGWRIALVRTLIEGGALVAGWALGGDVGVGTIIVVVLIGPCVALGLRLLDRGGAATGRGAAGTNPAR